MTRSKTKRRPGRQKSENPRRHVHRARFTDEENERLGVRRMIAEGKRGSPWPSMSDFLRAVLLA